MKVHLKSVMDLNMKDKTIQLLEENISDYLHDFRMKTSQDTKSPNIKANFEKKVTH